MSPNIPYEHEQELGRAYTDAARRVQTYSAFASPSLSSTVGTFAASFPQADPGVLYSVSQAVDNGDLSFTSGLETIRQATTVSLSDTERYDDSFAPTAVLSRGLDFGKKAASFGLNAMLAPIRFATKPLRSDASKTAIKYGAAAAEFSLQAANNVAARFEQIPQELGIDEALGPIPRPGMPLTVPSLDKLRGSGSSNEYVAPETSFWNGFIVSTDLGALLSGKDSGTGWFIGDAAYEYQQQQVARYRGGFRDLDGNLVPLSIGRTYAAGQGYTVEDRMFQFLSGAADFAVALRLPSVPGAKTVGKARAGEYGEQAAQVADKLPLIRSYAGLTNGVNRAIAKDKVPLWLNSRYGEALVDKLATVNRKEDVLRLFGGTIGINTADQIAKATTPEDMRRTLTDILGVTGRSADEVGIVSIDQLPKAPFVARFAGGNTALRTGRRLNGWIDNVVEQDTLFGRVTKQVQKTGRAFTVEGQRLRNRTLPNMKLRLGFEDPYEAAESVRDLSVFMDLLRYQDDDVIKVFGRQSDDAERVVLEEISRRDLMDEFADFAQDPSNGNLDRIQSLLYASVRQAVSQSFRLRTAGFKARYGKLSEEAIDEAAETLLDFGGKQADSVYGGYTTMDPYPLALFAKAEDVVPGLLDEEFPTSITPPSFDAIRHTDDGAEMISLTAPEYTAMLTSEMRRTELVLPNVDELRRATSRVAFLFEKGAPWKSTSIGKPRFIVERLDWGTDVFKKGVTKSGGYVTRALGDAMIMASTASGFQLGATHPFEWIAVMMGRKNKGSVLHSWDTELAPNNMGFIKRQARDVLNAGYRDIDPYKRQRAAYQRQEWTKVDFPEFDNVADFDRYVYGLLDDFQELVESPIVRLIAHGVPWSDDLPAGTFARLQRVTGEGLDDLNLEAMEPGGAFDLPRTIKGWIQESPDGRQEAERLNRMWRNLELPDDPGVRKSIYFIDPNTGDLVDNNWLNYFKLVENRMRWITGDNPMLKQALLGSPDGMPKLRVPRKYKGGEPVRDKAGNIVYEQVERKTKSGATMRDKDGNIKYKRGPAKTHRRGEPVLDLDGNQQFDFVDMFKGMEYRTDDTIDFFEYSDEALDAVRDHVRRGINDPEYRKRLPNQTKYRIRGRTKQDADGPVKRWWDAHNDLFFGRVFGAKDHKLFRAPAWKQAYWQIIDEVIEEMSPEDARHLLNRLKYEQFTSVRDRLVNIQKAKTRTRDGVKQYRVPDGGKIGWARNEIGGRWVDEIEYERVLAEAQADVDGLPSVPFTEYGFQQLGKKLRREDFDADPLQDFDVEWAAAYLGDPKRLERFVKQANGDVNAVYSVTAEQAHMAAGLYATEQTRRLFYNATDQSNFAAINRNMVPFAGAWAEVLRRYAREAFADNIRARNVAGIGADIQNAEPEASGRGFFEREPNTGELMFNIPFSEHMAPFIGFLGGYLGAQTAASFVPSSAKAPYGLLGLVGGIIGAGAGYATQEEDLKPSLSGTVKSLSLGFDIKPGFGPVVQIPASYALQNKPEYKDVLDVIAPYGAEELSAGGLAGSVTPGWADKLAAAIVANERTSTQFAQIQVDVSQALWATGNYDQTNPVDIQRWERDSRDKARGMMILSALAQFTGPIRPKLDFEVPVAYEGTIDSETVKGLLVEGSIKSNYVAAVYRSFQEEDFENATTRFLETFGPNMMMYLAPSTKTDEGVKGLGVSEAFGDWEMTNTEFANRYPDVYGYFAPTGTDFDYQTYLRQLQSGQRTRIVSLRELAADAEAVVGRALYRQFRREQGQSQTDLQEQMAREYRARLYREYPGFANAAINVANRDATINKLISAVYDPLVDDNEAAIGMREYFLMRSRAVSQAQSRRQNAGLGPALSDPLSGDMNTDLRIQLRLMGERLAVKYPQFERVWSRELFDEVEAL